MVHHIDGKGRCVDMAQIAVRISPRSQRNMCSIRIIRCPFRGRAVMTCPANSRDTAVMITGPQPGDGIGVAGIAIGCCDAMAWIFASGNYPIVTTHAYAGRRRRSVFILRGVPGNQIMAIVTLVGCHANSGMGRWRPVVLVGTNYVAACIVTTPRYHADVIPARRKPCIGSMTMIAGIGCLNSSAMTCRFTG